MYFIDYIQVSSQGTDTAVSMAHHQVLRRCLPSIPIWQTPDGLSLDCQYYFLPQKRNSDHVQTLKALEAVPVQMALLLILRLALLEILQGAMVGMEGRHEQLETSEMVEVKVALADIEVWVLTLVTVGQVLRLSLWHSAIEIAWQEALVLLELVRCCRYRSTQEINCL